MIVDPVNEVSMLLVQEVIGDGTKHDIFQTPGGFINMFLSLQVGKEETS